MNTQTLYRRYRSLQHYVGWTDDDADRVQKTHDLLQPHFAAIIDDFYNEIERQPEARKVITSGAAQIERLKGTLRGWLESLLSGPYDADFVADRFRVGAKHVDIGLDQVYTNVALSRIRTGLIRVLIDGLPPGDEAMWATVESLNKLLDLDLAIIEDAYQAEYSARQQRSERLATIGQVAAGVAHELRNPLNAVRTSAYYLLNARELSDEKLKEHLSRIERQVGIADHVITALTEFARLPIPDTQPVPLCECVRDVIALHPPSDEIDVSVDCPDSLPLVLADRDQFQIALGNLVRNAYDAMPHGGRLTLEGRRASDGVELHIIDTGSGIPSEHIGKIMEPLYSTKARGMGLGLALAKAILEKHDGGLRVESQPGNGSKFTLWLAIDKVTR